MTTPRGAATARRRVIALSVAVGVTIVVVSAALASSYVSGQRAEHQAGQTPLGTPSPAPSVSPSPAPPASTPPSTPPATPTVPGTDVDGFIGTPARCAPGEQLRMVVLTDQSQAVVCAANGGAHYYMGWRLSTGTAARIEGVLPAGPGWVARAPDATINITPAALVFSTSMGDITEPATAAWVA